MFGIIPSLKISGPSPYTSTTTQISKPRLLIPYQYTRDVVCWGADCCVPKSDLLSHNRIDAVHVHAEVSCRHERMLAIVERYVHGRMDALDGFPGGSETGT